MRIVFAGTPEFSVPTLEALLRARHDVVLVITQPDRGAGRGRRLQSSPVKTFAAARGLPVFQPDDVNGPETLEVIRQLRCDAVVVQAFGQWLAPELLAMPRLGCFNVHASLLPAYRGAAPVNWAVVNGEETSGVTVIRMNERIDTGEMLARREVAVDPDWTAGELARELAGVGAELLVRTLAEVEAGRARPVAQDASKASRAPKLTKRDGLIPWHKSARDVHNHIRGMTPWPGAFTFFTDTRTNRTLRLAVLRSSLPGVSGTPAEPGTILSVGGEDVDVACGEGALRLTEVKPAGGRAMSAGDFARGHDVTSMMRFTGDE